MESPPKQPDQELLDEGWTRRYTASGRRLTEIVDTYRSLGFEVRLEGLELSRLCNTCSEYLNCAAKDTKLIYTRKRS